jgi:hypothetical protein
MLTLFSLSKTNLPFIFTKIISLPMGQQSTLDGGVVGKYMLIISGSSPLQPARKTFSIAAPSASLQALFAWAVSWPSRPLFYDRTSRKT